MKTMKYENHINRLVFCPWTDGLGNALFSSSFCCVYKTIFISEKFDHYFGILHDAVRNFQQN